MTAKGRGGTLPFSFGVTKVWLRGSIFVLEDSNQCGDYNSSDHLCVVSCGPARCLWPPLVSCQLLLSPRYLFSSKIPTCRGRLESQRGSASCRDSFAYSLLFSSF